MSRPRTIKLRAGFIAGVVPDSECLNRDGQPIGTEWDEYARKVTPEEAGAPLTELFADVPQEPLPEHWEWPRLALAEDGDQEIG